jgi:hypothetical protein
MASTRAPEPRRSSALAEVGKRAVAGLVLLAVALVALKLIVGTVVGLITGAVTLLLVAAVVVGVIWAARRL